MLRDPLFNRVSDWFLEQIQTRENEIVVKSALSCYIYELATHLMDDKISADKVNPEMAVLCLSSINSQT